MEAALERLPRLSGNHLNVGPDGNLVIFDRHGFTAGHTSEYLDGDLPEASRRRIERHTSGCPQCATRLASLRRMIELLPSLNHAPSTGMSDRVLERLRREASVGLVVVVSARRQVRLAGSEELKPELVEGVARSADLASADAFLGFSLRAARGRPAGEATSVRQAAVSLAESEPVRTPARVEYS